MLTISSSATVTSSVSRCGAGAGATLEGVYLDFVYQPITDGEGAVTGIFVQGHDITAQHRGRADPTNGGRR